MAELTKPEFFSGPLSIPETVYEEPNPALLDPNLTEGRKLRRLLGNMVDTFFAIVQKLTSNVIRGNDLKVRDLTRRDAVKPLYLVIGQRCYVTNNATAAQAAAGTDNGGAEYYLLRDSSGPLTAFIDADQATTTTASGRWVLITGSAAQQRASYAQYVPSNQPIAISDVKRYTVPGDVERLYLALTAQPLPGRGVNNVPPTGQATDPNWLPFSPITASLSGRIFYKLLQAQAALAKSDVKPGQPYVVDFGPDAKGFAQLMLLDGAEDSSNFTSVGELRVNGASLGLYTADVKNGTLVAFAGGGGGTAPALPLEFSVYSYDPKTRQLLVFASAGALDILAVGLGEATPGNVLFTYRQGTYTTGVYQTNP